MSKLKQLRLSLLTAENLYYYAYNQVYKSRLDIQNFHHLTSPNLKVKLLNRISNENCKVIDYLQVVGTLNSSEESLTYVLPAMNIIQNFFSELNQDKEIYNQIIELEKDLSQTKKAETEGSLRFLKVLKEDFELKSGINHPDDTQVNIINCLTKIDDFSQQFGASLAFKSKPVLFPLSLYEKLPPELQRHISNYIPKDSQIQEEGKEKFVKPVFNYAELSSIFTNCPDIIVAREIFNICLNFNRNSLFVLYSLLKERASYAAHLGFENYLHFQMSSLTTWKYSTLPFKENFGYLQKFIRRIANTYQDEASQTLFYLQKYLPKQGTELHLSDVFFLRNKLTHQSLNLSGVKFLFNDVLDFLTKITSNLFGLTLTYQESEGIYSTDQIIEVQVKDANNHVIGSIYLDIFSRKEKAELNQQFFIQSGTNLAIPENLKRNQKPIFFISCNVSKASNETQINHPLQYDLNFQAVKILVHEFGHCVNNILNSDSYQLVSSTLPIDYAETMASLFENICLHPSTLEKYFTTYNYDKNDNVFRILQDFSAVHGVFRPWSLLEQIFYANVDIKFHSLGKKAIDTLNPKQLAKIYSEALRDTYGNIPNLNLSEYDDLSWFTNIEHLGSYGGQYFAYLLADYYSERVVRGALINDIFDMKFSEKTADKDLVNYLFRNAHSEDIFSKLWLE